MKKLSMILISLVIVCGLAGAANAVPISIGDESTLSLTGIINYTYSAISTDINDLVVGDSASVDLFTVNIIYGLGSGTATVSIDFDLPVDDAYSATGSYTVLGVLNWAVGTLTWDNSLEIYYGNGGLLTLVLDDLCGVSLGSAITISGTLTNESAPVPEPATMLLLGTGLVGLTGASRKKLFGEK